MKKLKFLITGLLFTLLVTVMVIHINVKHNVTKGQDIALSNMEALAQGEGEKDCFENGNTYCPSDGEKHRIVVAR